MVNLLMTIIKKIHKKLIKITLLYHDGKSDFNIPKILTILQDKKICYFYFKLITLLQALRSRMSVVDGVSGLLLLLAQSGSNPPPYIN